MTTWAVEPLRLVERTIKETTVDLGARGDSPGDLLVFDNLLFDSANKTKLGSNQGSCVRIAPGKTWDCSMTLQLEGGSLTAHGRYSDEGDSAFAITGGTGKYSVARGSITVHARDAKGAAYDFSVDLR